MVELLVVMGIMTVLATPSIMSLAFQRGQDFTKEVYDLQAMFALARTTAMAKNTFVWTGLGQGTVNGRPVLMVVAYSSQNGMNDTTTQGNLVPVMRRQLLPGVQVAPASARLSGLDAAGTDLAGVGAPAWTLPPQTVNGTAVPVQQAILFSPTGEAFLSASPLASIQIGLQPLRGAVADARDVAALQISGITSQTEVFRN